MSEGVKQKKVVVYIPEDDYKALRIKLIQAEKSVSGWVREQIRKFLNQ